MDSENKIFFHLKSMETLDHYSGASLGPSDLIGRIYVRDHLKSMETLDPHCKARLDSRDLIGRTYIGDHYTLLHTKYIICGIYGFRRHFLKFFPLNIYGNY